MFEIDSEAGSHCEGHDHDDDQYCCNCYHYHGELFECPTHNEPCGDYRCCKP